MKFSNQLSLNRRRALLLPIVIAFLLFIINADAAPYQELEPRKGWVPVYIRYGDTPLSEINPKLAEAFDEDETPKIESANLTVEGGNTQTPSSSTTSTPKEAPNADASLGTKSEAKDSDIASFDVIKGLDESAKSQ